MPGYTGEVQVTHAEIVSWQKNSHLTLSPWEAKTIRRLSGVYIKECRDALDPSCKAPWPTPEYEMAVRARYSEALKANLRSLAQ